MRFGDQAVALDADDVQPLYQQLQQAIRSAIGHQALSPGEALPSERDLALRFDLSTISVRKALDGLVGEGLLTRGHGTRFHVADRVTKHFARLSSFTEDMITRGLTPYSAWIDRCRGSASAEEAWTLGLSIGAPVFRFSRVRYADDQAMALEYSTIAAQCLTAETSVGDSLYAALEVHGHRPTRATQRLRAVRLSEDQANLLDVQAGDVGLLIERRGFLSAGQPVELTRSYYRGDSYDFIAQLDAHG